MAPLRSPRRWWRERVLAPIDGLYAVIDEDLDDLDDSPAVATAALAPVTSVASVVPVGPLATQIPLDRPA